MRLGPPGHRVRRLAVGAKREPQQNALRWKLAFLSVLSILVPLTAPCASSSPPREQLQQLDEDEWTQAGVASSAAVILASVRQFDVTAVEDTLGVRGGVVLRHTVLLGNVEWLTLDGGPDTLRVDLPPDWPHARKILVQCQQVNERALLHLNTWRRGWKIRHFDPGRPGGSRAVRCVPASEVADTRTSIHAAARKTTLDTLARNADVVVIGRASRYIPCVAQGKSWRCIEIDVDTVIKGNLRPGPITIVPSSSQTRVVGRSILFLRSGTEDRFETMISDAAIVRISHDTVYYRGKLRLDTALARMRAGAASQPAAAD